MLENLRDGWYKVTELEPAHGFTIKEPATQEVYIEGGESKSLTFENVPLNAIVVHKTDSVTGEALGGATFQLRYLGGASGTGGTVIGQRTTGANGHLSSTGLYTTNANGEIRISGITGTIVVKETRTIEGYTIDEATRTQTLTVNPEDTQTLTFYNTPGTTLTIQKYIEGTDYEPLEGVIFLITDSAGTPLGPSNG